MFDILQTPLHLPVLDENQEEVAENTVGQIYFPEAELEEGDAGSDVESGRNQSFLEEPFHNLKLHRFGPAGRSMKRRRILD